jgi:hypothetical protein
MEVDRARIKKRRHSRERDSALMQGKTMDQLDLFDGDDPCATGVRLSYAYSLGRFRSADDVAAYFGLRRLGPKWVSLSRDEAQRTLEHVLHLELAHGSIRFEAQRAKAMSESFISRFSTEASFFSNCRWFERPNYDAATGVVSSPQFESATSATVDGGVLVSSQTMSGVFWLEDED